MPQEGSLFATADAALLSGATDAQVAGWVRERNAAQKKSGVLTHLVKNRWAAVLSAAFDSHFEDDYRQYVERKKPGWLQVVTLTDPSLPHPPNTVPVLKLLGAVYQDEFAFSTAHYLACQTRWRAAVRTFIDLVKASPVLCVGMEECPEILHHLVREFLSDRTTTPARLLLLADDPLVGDRTLGLLARQGLRITAVRATAGDFCRAVTPLAPVGSRVYRVQSLVGVASCCHPLPAGLTAEFEQRGDVATAAVGLPIAGVPIPRTAGGCLTILMVDPRNPLEIGG